LWAKEALLMSHLLRLLRLVQKPAWILRCGVAVNATMLHCNNSLDPKDSNTVTSYPAQYRKSSLLCGWNFTLLYFFFAAILRCCDSALRRRCFAVMPSDRDLLTFRETPAMLLCCDAILRPGPGRRCFLLNDRFFFAFN
jgi:hypothetical protein